MDIRVILSLFERYPKLETFIAAGTISLKLAREILDVDRWLMYDIFKKLVEAGAVTAQGATSWRATAGLRQLLEVRKHDIARV